MQTPCLTSARDLHATTFFWNPGIIEIGFQNHPPNWRLFEFEIIELDNLNLAFLGLLPFIFPGAL
jgi:hypothetical protein